MPIHVKTTVAIVLLLGPSLTYIVYKTAVNRAAAMSVAPDQLPGTVVMYQSHSCGACVRMLPIVKAAQREGYSIRIVDVNSNPQDAYEKGIRGIPAFLLYRDGHEYSRRSGMMSAGTLREFCRGL